MQLGTVIGGFNREYRLIVVEDGDHPVLGQRYAVDPVRRGLDRDVSDPFAEPVRHLGVGAFEQNDLDLGEATAELGDQGR